MRIFKNFLGEEEDLDNPETYSHLPSSCEELKRLMFTEIGMYYCYTHFWHRDAFIDNEKDTQVERCEKLIKNFLDSYKQRMNDVMWLQEQIYLFRDETENMC